VAVKVFPHIAAAAAGIKGRSAGFDSWSSDHQVNDQQVFRKPAAMFPLTALGVPSDTV
jgi:hypothetical protein